MDELTAGDVNMYLRLIKWVNGEGELPLYGDEVIVNDSDARIENGVKIITG